MKRFVLLVSIMAWALSQSAHAESLNVMSFNLYHGGDARQQPLEQSAQVVRAANADVVGLQETSGLNGEPRPDNGAKIAQILGWNYVDQGGSTGILTRHFVLAITPRKWGVLLQTNGGQSFWMFNAHLMHAPYQPYQLLNIPYANAPFLQTEDAAIDAAKQARAAQIERMLTELRPALKSGFPVFVTGDFNEPSHQDWTRAAAQAKLHPLKVEWPSTKTLVAAGLIDSFRALFPDEVQRPGHTWTPLTQSNDPKDHHDRIDFVFYGGQNVRPTASSIVGEAAPQADIVVTPYPSDHRAVVSTFEINR